jgi:hypothetical protein
MRTVSLDHNKSPQKMTKVFLEPPCVKPGSVIAALACRIQRVLLYVEASVGNSS